MTGLLQNLRYGRILRRSLGFTAVAMMTLAVGNGATAGAHRRHDGAPQAGGRPCPSYTALLNPLDGAAGHVGQRVSFVVIAKAQLPRILAFAQERSWRLLVCRVRR